MVRGFILLIMIIGILGVAVFFSLQFILERVRIPSGTGLGL